jgi:hypothetical protein
VDEASAGSVVDLTGCSYAGTVRIAQPIHVKGFTLTSPAGATAVTVEADDVTLEDVTLRGPQATTFHDDEVGIAVRRIAGDPVRRLTIIDSAISHYGYGGLYLRHVLDTTIRGTTITDGVYAGIMLLSAQRGLIEGNRIARIGTLGVSANQNNAYGISLNHPGELPASSDIVVRGNTIEDVPTWEALDTHGGIRISFIDNTVLRSRRGVMITTGPGGSAAVDALVEGNRFLDPVSIPAGQQYAIAPVNSVDARITGNTITGWGEGHDMIRQYPNPGLVYSGNSITP